VSQTLALAQLWFKKTSSKFLLNNMKNVTASSLCPLSEILHCKPCLGEIEQYNYNVSLLALLWSFRYLGVKM